MSRFAFGAIVFAIKPDVQNDAIAAVGHRCSGVRSSWSALNGNSAASQHYRRERQQPTEQGRNTIDWRPIYQFISVISRCYLAPRCFLVWLQSYRGTAVRCRNVIVRNTLASKYASGCHQSQPGRAPLGFTTNALLLRIGQP